MPYPVTMTAHHLVLFAQHLEAIYGRETPIYLAAPYGDQGQTLQALPLHKHYRLTSLRETPYSESGWAVVCEGDTGSEHEDAPEVLVLGQ